jgi:hypothetical protein
MVGARASGNGDGVMRLWRDYGSLLFPGGAPPHVILVLNAR